VVLVEMDVSVSGAELVDLMIFDVLDEELKVCVDNPVKELDAVRDVDIKSLDEVAIFDVRSVGRGFSIVFGGKSEANKRDKN